MPFKTDRLTLDEFTGRERRLFPQATGELSALLRDIGLAAKRIHAEVAKAGLVEIIGSTGTTNVQGEQVQLLDVFAQHQLTHVLRHGRSCAGIASEELENTSVFDDKINNQSKYVVLFDPLDGSTNIDTNNSIGSIFGIYRRRTEKGKPCELSDFLQPGSCQAAAGYIIFGPSTMLVYATRRGVNGFTLDPVIGEFCLSHPGIRCPEYGFTYSVNHAYFFQYTAGIRQFITDRQLENLNAQQCCSLRYAGSMVADMHRTLLKGGLFLYPATRNKPAGKLRLMYECNPFAFIMEIAGGQAISDSMKINDIVPDSLHQVSTIYTGSNNMVEALKTFLPLFMIPQ